LKLKKISHRQPGFQLRASGFQPIACEHLQKLCNAGSRLEALFFNTLLGLIGLGPDLGWPQGDMA
jgi:hypothetical protein